MSTKCARRNPRLSAGAGEGAGAPAMYRFSPVASSNSGSSGDVGQVMCGDLGSYDRKKPKAMVHVIATRASTIIVRRSPFIAAKHPTDAVARVPLKEVIACVYVGNTGECFISVRNGALATAGPPCLLVGQRSQARLAHPTKRGK